MSNQIEEERFVSQLVKVYFGVLPSVVVMLVLVCTDRLATTIHSMLDESKGRICVVYGELILRTL